MRERKWRGFGLHRGPQWAAGEVERGICYMFLLASTVTFQILSCITWSPGYWRAGSRNFCSNLSGLYVISSHIPHETSGLLGTLRFLEERSFLWTSRDQNMPRHDQFLHADRGCLFDCSSGPVRIPGQSHGSQPQRPVEPRQG